MLPGNHKTNLCCRGDDDKDLHEVHDEEDQGYNEGDEVSDQPGKKLLRSSVIENLISR